jgi:hypothetical protein
MNLDSNGLAIVLGAFLLLIGILGGGFEIKEIKIPRVGRIPRGLSVSLGLLMVFLGMRVAPNATQTPATGTVPPEAAATGFVPAEPQAQPRPRTPPPGLVRVEQQEPSEEASVDEHRAAVERQLNGAAALLRENGFEMVDSNFGAVEANTREQFDILLEAGYQYGFIAACDNDCDDIDIILVDDDGEQVASDLATDALPVVQYTPAASAEHRVIAHVVSCDLAPCRYGVGVFRK